MHPGIMSGSENNIIPTLPLRSFWFGEHEEANRDKNNHNAKLLLIEKALESSSTKGHVGKNRAFEAIAEKYLSIC